MDQLNEKLRLEEEEKLMGPLTSLASLGMHKSPSTSSNGSRVAVPEEVIIPWLVVEMVSLIVLSTIYVKSEGMKGAFVTGGAC